MAVQTVLNQHKAKKHPRSSMVFGSIIAALGIAAILFPLIASLAAEQIIGGILLASGAFKAVEAFWRPQWHDVGVAMVSGLLALAAGAFLLLFPLTGILSLTFVVAVLFLADGAFRIFSALRRRTQTGWGWSLLGGVVPLVLGAFVLLQWPYAATWLLGMLIGVDLLVTGGRQIRFALTSGDSTKRAMRSLPHAYHR